MINGRASHRNSQGKGPLERLRSGLPGLVRTAISVSLVLQVGGAPAAAQPVVTASDCCATQRIERSGGVRPTPDEVADYAGGIAARLREADGTAVPGRLYLLLAATGSDAPARLFDEQPYTHGRRTHADTVESNERAVAAAEAIAGTEIEPTEFTSAPAGGPSGGLIYLIAYLNLISNGAFTGGVEVAATGELRDEGYIGHIMNADAKLAAARLAGADVVFTPWSPAPATLGAHADRQAGHSQLSRHGRVALADERRLDDFEAWGASRPAGVDVIVVGHIADVAAYLCGAGSAYACEITVELGATLTSDTITWFDTVRSTRTPDSGPARGDSGVDGIH